MTPLPTALLVLALAAPPAGQWAELPPLPDPGGFAGAFAGTAGGALVVAGGANFPGRKPWDGGAKAWTDVVFALDAPAGTWRVAGRLPRPLGYGVSVSHRGGVVCAGGSDAARHYPDVFRLEWAGGKLRTTPLPPLPAAVANGCGALVGDVMYVVGGQATPDATAALNTVYALDLSAAEPRWRGEKPLPGPGRILATAAACDGALYVAGGAGLTRGANGSADRGYRTDAYRLRPGRGWERVADLPRPAVAAPSPAPADAGGFYVLGGDDGSKVGFRPPDRHPGFARTILRFDVGRGVWAAAGEWPTPRVTVPAVGWAGRWVVPGGEARPGVRSPAVWAFTPPPLPPTEPMSPGGK